jgi:hypothetical protein
MDIVNKLRVIEHISDDEVKFVNPDGPEAADEIERLRLAYKTLWLDHKRLRESLDRIASVEGGDVTALWKIMRDIARSALKGDE